MKFGHFFIDRPRFATVLSILIVMVGALAYRQLPISQYPEITPPSVQVGLVYPGATAEVVAETVAGPIEQAINGVEGMLYMTSSSTADGALSVNVAFELGTDLDTAQVEVQNRIAAVEPRLPEDVRRLGISVRKSSADFLLVIHLLSPDDTFDELYISNYALLRLVDSLKRIRGVGQTIVFGAREYGMRIWLDPERLAAHGLTAGEVVNALREQNVQVSAGTLGQPPTTQGLAFQFTVGAESRFERVEEFEEVVVKTGDAGRLTRVRDVARVELGAQDYVRNSYLNGRSAAGIGIFQRPGSNALATAQELRSTVEELSKDFPPGLEYRIAYDPTVFVEESVEALNHTIFEAVALVVLVILVFLQSWRAALIPIAAIPVSLVGTFAVMQVLDFSLNSLSLFGLVLAIGIVVDDAIVVVEDMERNLRLGLAPWQAARQTMTEVGAALISMALVLVAVFLPTIFIGGISGQFFRQFGVTVAVATVISAFNSLTLSPALGALLLRPHVPAGEGEDSSPGHGGWLAPFFAWFNRTFDRFNGAYARWIQRLLRHPVLALGVFALLIGAGVVLFRSTPAGFIPQQDQGFLIVAATLPPGASLERTDAVALEAEALVRAQPGVEDVVAIVGFSGANFSTASNAAAMFVLLEPVAERGEALTADRMVGNLFGVLGTVPEAQFFVIAPAPVRGLGIGGGFKMMVQDRSGGELPALEAATWQLASAASADPRIARAFTTFNTSQPRYFLDIDRIKAQEMGISLDEVFRTLQIQVGSAYVNDFNRFGRTYRVTAQAEAPFRAEPEDLDRMYVRNRAGGLVPLSALIEVRQATGSERVVRHNLYPAAELQGAPAPGFSSADAIAAMEELAAQHLPVGYGFEWTEIAFQEKLAGQTGLLVFPLSVLFVVLLLTAQYESWSLPIAVVLIVPLCVVFALGGIALAGYENNILTQIGFVVLIGLACKNSILVVEFARQKEDQGLDRFEAAAEAARLRLRPILMTAFAFILGVLPLVLATGSGFEMRRNLGTAVFSGMIGVTLSGLFLTPVFYVLIRGLLRRGEPRAGGDDEVETDPAFFPSEAGDPPEVGR